MKNKITALLTAGMMLIPATAMPPAQAAEKSGLDSVIGRLPDWTPLTFSDAMYFYNLHGQCWLSDNYICVVRPMLKSKRDDYELTTSGSMEYVNTPASTGTRVLEVEIPEKPDPEDLFAVANYESYCDSLGLRSFDYSFFEDYAASDDQFVFEVDMFRVLEGLDLNINLFEKCGDAFMETAEYSFENPDGTTIETDVNSWLPDCNVEYIDYYDEYGPLSVRDNYVVYLTSVNYSAGETLTEEQNGKGKLEQCRVSDCNRFELLPQYGEPVSKAYLYKPTADGDAEITWDVRTHAGKSDMSRFVRGMFEIKDNCSSVVDVTPGSHGTTVITFMDKTTGKPVEFMTGDEPFLLKRKNYPLYRAQRFDITSNPCTIDSLKVFEPEWIDEIYTSSPYGTYEIDKIEVTSQEDECIAVNCWLKWRATGDLNGDRNVTVSDYILLQEWLAGYTDVKISEWRAADLCLDNRINMFDLCLLREELCQRNPVVVIPEVSVGHNGAIAVKSDTMLYTGPGEEYDTICPVENNYYIYELGYNSDNKEWMYVSYRGTYGWIPIFDENGSYNIKEIGEQIDKPVIYLYPEKETDVHVELELTESELSTTYPRYNNGWDVTAYPDGRLTNKSDGTHHRYLFWDSVNSRTEFDLSRGFCVSGEDTESFLREKLTYMGLTEDEMNEFIVYWLPRMEHNAYNLITFQGKAYTDSAKLSITPEPDSLCRVFMAYLPLDSAVEIEPQQLDTFERKGFTVVEWGGTEL